MEHLHFICCGAFVTRIVLPAPRKPEISYRKINQMNVLAVAQSYFDAWSHRIADGIIAAFTEGGTFPDRASLDLEQVSGVQ